MPTFTAEESSLSSWAGPYVTEMLGRGQALAGLPYQAYMGPLTAGESALQTQAFQGLAGLSIPTNQQMTYNPQSFTGMAPTAPIAQQPTATAAQDYSVRKILTPEEKLLQSQLREAAGPAPTTADLFKALGMAPSTAQQGQMPSSIFEGLGGTASGAALDSSLAVQKDIPYYMADNFGFSGTNTVEDQATAREMGLTPLQYAQAGGMGANVDQRAVQAAAQQPMQQSPIEQYMSPYLQGALDPQYAAAQRQAEIQAQKLQSQYGKAGAYGGSRQGVAEAELQRGLLDRMAGITGTGYQQAFEQAQRQFNAEQDRQMQAANQAQRYGLDVLREQQAGGATQRGIESQGIAADIAQFEQERDFPLKNVQFMQSLLQSLPLETQSYSYIEPSGLQTLAGGASDVQSILDLLSRPNSSAGGGTAATPQYDMNALATYKDNYMTAGMGENEATLQAMKDIGMIS
jgi:hypothetical protein